MRVVITGASRGIGRACVKKFLDEGHEVFGIDVENHLYASRTYLGYKADDYAHYCRNVKSCRDLPQIKCVDILINNAGTQDNDAIDVNLKGLIRTTEEYGLQPNIKSICNMASVSAHNGAEFPYYVASKGGVLSYTKWTAKEIAKYGATCNSIDPGGVITPLNICVIEDAECWDKIMQETPLKRWATVEEIAEWAYFMTVINRFCTGQSIIIDGGEAINHNFIWKD